MNPSHSVRIEFIIGLAVVSLPAELPSSIVLVVVSCGDYGRVGRGFTLVQQNVQRLLVDTRLRKLNLGLLLLGSVHDGSAAYLGHLALIAVEGPHAYLVTDDVLHEEDATVEAQGEFVEQLDVLQHVVV